MASADTERPNTNPSPQRGEKARGGPTEAAPPAASTTPQPPPRTGDPQPPAGPSPEEDTRGLAVDPSQEKDPDTAG